MNKFIFTSLICILITLKVNSQNKSIIQDWTSYTQFVKVSDFTGKKFRVSASIRKEAKNKTSWASLWVRVDNKNGNDSFFKNDAGASEASNEWEKFSIEGVVDINANHLYFGALVINKGTYYFDDFKVEVQKNGKDWEEIKVNNPSFETNNANDGSDFWSEGIHYLKIVNVENFKISYATDNPYSGKKCLKIVGL